MKQFITILIALTVVVLMSVPAIAQETVGDGYAKIFERSEFETSPYQSIVADEVHGGYDLDKDGNLEFFVLTDHSNPNGPGDEYTTGCSVYLYEWAGAEFVLEWSWFDTLYTTGGASFPTAAVADLDADGNQEIILGIPHGTGNPAPDVSPSVIQIFEFGTEGGPSIPTATWIAGAAPGTNTRPAGMAAGDIDGDGEDEVAVGFRAYSTSSTDDALMIFSLDGGFAGPFTQFKTEMIDTVGDYGSIYATDITDIDNDGNMEAYFPIYSGAAPHVWYEASGTDTYVKYELEGIEDGTIHGVSQVDIDGNGSKEIIYGNWDGRVIVVNGVSDLAAIDSTNQEFVAEVSADGCRGLTAGDYNGNGNADIFMGGNYGGSVIRMSYIGEGDILDSTSYVYEEVYRDSTEGAIRVYSVSFPGDTRGVMHGGSTSTDMNGNGEPEVLIGIEDGADSTQSWIIMIEGNGVSKIELDLGAKVLKSYSLRQNYPNPFNPTTTISYDIPVAEKVVLRVFDMLGREVKTLVNGDVVAGSHTAVWDGTNNSGVNVASGMYVYKLQAGKTQINKKMTLMR
jgi:hypothetical protein